MAHHVITLRVDAAGTVRPDRTPVIVAPSDTVVWTSDQGAVSVSFDDSPFEGVRHFDGHKGGHTTIARVRLDAQRGKLFACTALIDGKGGPGTYGVEIVP